MGCVGVCVERRGLVLGPSGAFGGLSQVCFGSLQRANEYGNRDSNVSRSLSEGPIGPSCGAILGLLGVLYVFSFLRTYHASNPMNTKMAPRGVNDGFIEAPISVEP